ncbi:MAG: ABC transporter permease subunit [Pseudomonadota bacterium]
MTILEILTEYRPAFLKGLGVTIELSLITWVVGIGLGTLLGAIAHIWPRIGWIVRSIAFVIGGIPFLVFLYWVHYPLQIALGVVASPFLSAATILSTLNIFGVSQIVRSALDDFPEQYLDAARVCGLSQYQTLRRVQLPLVARQAIPPTLNLQVTMLQMTLFASLISVEELFRVSQRINASIHQPIEIYTALGLFFLAICIPMNGLASWLRWRFTRDISER